MVAEIQADSIHSKALPDLITKLLKQRQAMLVAFNRLAVLKSYPESASVRLLLRRFCQMLMDYLALGHFEVYQCLEEHSDHSERFRAVGRLAKFLYLRIDETTRTAVAFNDRHESQREPASWDSLGRDLSFLGEQLADRIELEDRLITAVRAALNPTVERGGSGEHPGAAYQPFTFVRHSLN